MNSYVLSPRPNNYTNLAAGSKSKLTLPRTYLYYANAREKTVVYCVSFNDVILRKHGTNRCGVYITSTIV
jgi:hypothetical protein